MIDILTSPWIPAAVLVLAACGARIVAKSWRAPSAFVLGLWSIYVLVPLSTAPEYRVSGLAVWALVAMLGALAVGAALGECRLQPIRVHAVKLLPINRMLWASLIFASFAFAGTLYFGSLELKIHGLDATATDLFLVGRLVALGRYDLGEQQPLLVRLLVLWVFPAAVLGGMSWTFAQTWRRRLLCLAWLVPALLYTVLNAAKANTLIAIILGASGYVSMRIIATKRRQPKPAKVLLAVAASLIVAVSFFFGVDMVRGNQAGSEMVNPVDWTRLKATTLGYLPVFSYWIDHADDASFKHASLGAYTFAGILEAAGLRNREVGVYTEFVMVDSEQDNNLYTAFRGVVEDFSLPGAIAFLFLMGFASGYAYRRCAIGQHAWAPGLSLFYAFVVWSPVISVLNYNGPIIAAISASMVMITTKAALTLPRHA